MSAFLFAFACCVLRVVLGDEVPFVDVSLAAADAPAELVNAIASRDDVRESFESSISSSDVRAFNAALRAARPQIESLAKAIASKFKARQSSSFLSRGAHVVDVHVPDIEAMDLDKVLLTLDEFEGAASAEEAREFNARLGDFTTLTKFVLREAQAAANTFLTSAHSSAASFVVRRAAGAGTSAFADMDSRRGIGEQHFRARHLSLAVALLQRENDMLKKSLRQEMAVTRSAGVSFFAEAASAKDRLTLKLVPPSEDERDVMVALDALALAERAKQHSSHSLFASDKQRVLEIGSADFRRALATS